MSVVVRFAPSPTGYLHIGGARTALFNWLYAKHNNGKFLLRIEDTDRARSTDAAITAILDGMKWLGLDWDGDAVFQFARTARHAEVAHQMLREGKAYYCYCTPEDLAMMRDEASKLNKPFKYDGRWRDKSPADAPEGVKPSIRIKAPREGSIVIEDAVQGRVEVQCSELDDMVLLRSDGTPTYMHAVVVDDHDMGITHVIRGDDHLGNTHRQALIYKAMGWELPTFAHVPMIHGIDGAKLSKRHGALGVDAYRDMGYLPEAMRNYLLRLGWSHGNDELISTEQAIEWFNLESIGRSPSRFDFEKLNSLNGHYIRTADNKRLLSLIKPLLENPTETGLKRIEAGMNGLKERAKTIKELAESARFYIARPMLDTKALEALSKGREHLNKIIAALDSISPWESAHIETALKNWAEGSGLKMGQVLPVIRAGATGTMQSPALMEVLSVLGKEETVARLRSLS
ncbi:MAG: glutamate--tRNA ligase [Proteobacteria bacterium]|nr:glutamate--tRNA ligase [Pseudomonadota bacterium]